MHCANCGTVLYRACGGRIDPGLFTDWSDLNLTGCLDFIHPSSAIIRAFIRFCLISMYSF